MKPMGKRHRVFVYGTLRAGGVENSRMSSALLLGNGQVRGRLFRVDWYPAVVLGSKGEIQGEVYEVDEEQLAALDEYEGGEYKRVLVDVMGVASGPAWIWEWDLPVDGLQELESGDWLKEVRPA